jgi:D-3-phosphoglycerate dehydrogenase / 2-oxoglutarate reductase
MRRAAASSTRRRWRRHCAAATRGAGLDVFAEEPLPADHPLRGVANAVLTPHLGAATEEAQHNVAVEIAEAVRAALAEGDLTRAVNAPAIGGEEMRRLRPLLELAERSAGSRLRWRMAPRSTSRSATRVRTTSWSGPSPRPPWRARSARGRPRRHQHGERVHIAESRGITVERSRVGTHGPYEEFIEVRLHYGCGRGARRRRSRRGSAPAHRAHRPLPHRGAAARLAADPAQP